MQRNAKCKWSEQCAGETSTDWGRGLRESPRSLTKTSGNSCIWGGITSCVGTGLTLARHKIALQKWTWESYLTTDWLWGSNVSLWQRRPTAPQALGGEVPAGGEGGDTSFIHSWWVLSGVPWLVLGPNGRKALTNWSKSSEGHWDDFTPDDWRTWPLWKGWDSWSVPCWEQKAW